MNKAIWKFELKFRGDKEIEMPVGSEILTMQMHNEIPCLWALVDPNAEKEIRHFEVFSTGHQIHYGFSVSRNHIGTYQLHGGDSVFHVFEYTGV